MTNIQKTILFWASLVLMLVLVIFLLSSVDQQVSTDHTISFTGEGKMSAKPDVAVISFAAVTEAATSKAAQDANSQKSQKITDFLESQDIDEKDIKTTSYNIYPQYSYPRPIPVPLGVEGSAPQYYDPNPKITGYQVSQSFEVKLRNLEQVSAILDGLVTAGANQVHNLGFQIDEPEKLKAEARAKAIEDAEEKAEELEDQLDIKLGKIVNFSENTNGWPFPYAMEAKDMVGGRGGGGPSVPTGENEIVINVTVTYQIK